MGKIKKDKIYFSIIIPIYNVEKYLGECLDSVLNQTYDDYEVICVDDKSTDGSNKILHDYGDKFENIRIIENNVNRGVSYARNVGIDDAIGEYLLFLDADDTLHEKALEIVNSKLIENKVDTLFYNIRYLDSNTNNGRFDLRKYYGTQTGKNLFINFMHDNIFLGYAWSAVYRRAYLQNNDLKFIENLLHEDTFFFLENILRARSVTVLNEALYNYRGREGSITYERSKMKKDSLFIVIARMLMLWRQYEGNPELDLAFEKYILDNFIVYKRYELVTGEDEKLEIGSAAEKCLFKLMHLKENVQLYVDDFNSNEIEEIKKCQGIWIYGAGVVGSAVLEKVKLLDISPKGFLVSKKKENGTFRGYQVYEYNNELVGDADCIIIGVGPKLINQIHEILIKDNKNIILARTPTLR